MAKKPTDSNQRIDQPTGTPFVGHEWDGIEELDTPMPRWWLYTLYLTIIWALAYVIMYPAWPLLNSATEGMLGWTSRGQLAAEMKAADVKRAPLINSLAAIPVEQLLADQKLYQGAVAGGAAAFKVHCVQCHGSGAMGSAGYPNLNDDDWLWGGDMASIHYTLTHGIRNPDHPETRVSAMPAFDGILSPVEISQVVAHVQSFSGKAKPNAKGKELFATNCASCHGMEGKGLREFGAPNLSDNIWLYGGDTASITQTVLNSRQGVMPRWNDKLDPATIKMLAAYVHSLGGGEATPAAPTTKATNGQP
ncbi:MAG: cytochrome-c oxidase, cbb3-type subunit III [Sphingomonadales bacterium]|nr:cytochrome-c oxidase, cbb3-type subunit III [Sphingomonadales bacterium]